MTEARPKSHDSIAHDLAFDEAFADLFRCAARVALRLLGNPEAARDIAQETLARALVRWATLSGDPTPWVARVAANLALDQLRRRRLILTEIEVNAPDVAQRLDLARALARLPRRQRDALVLRFICDLSEKDTAARLGCSTGAVKQHVTRGLASLRSGTGLEMLSTSEIRSSADE